MKFDRTLVSTGYSANSINSNNGDYDIFTLESNKADITSVKSNITINGSTSGYPTSHDDYTM